MGSYGIVKFDIKNRVIKYQITEKIMKIYSLQYNLMKKKRFIEY